MKQRFYGLIIPRTEACELSVRLNAGHAWQCVHRKSFAVDCEAITQSFFRPQITISDCWADLSTGGWGWWPRRTGSRPGMRATSRVPASRTRKGIRRRESEKARPTEVRHSRIRLGVHATWGRDTHGWVRHGPLHSRRRQWKKEKREIANMKKGHHTRLLFTSRPDDS